MVLLSIQAAFWANSFKGLKEFIYHEAETSVVSCGFPFPEGLRCP